MTFIMIQPVEAQDYPFGFDASIRFHFARSICEPGTNYILKARGPRPLAVEPASPQPTGMFGHRSLPQLTVI